MKSSVVNAQPMRPVTRAHFIVMFGLLLSANSALASDSSPTSRSSTAQQCELTDHKREMLSHINAARSQDRQCGSQRFTAVKPLVWNCSLEAAAQRHTDDMAEHDYFSHTGSDGQEVQHRVSDSGYTWQAVGENIAAGHLSSDAAIKGWLDSPGHCRNIMSDAFTEVGMASTKPSDASASYPSYWAQVLANPR